MAFQVSQFTGDINPNGGGFARANLFSVQLANPSAVTGIPTRGSDLLVKAAQFPGSTVAPMPVNYGGRIIKLTGFRTFDNWTVTVINDEDFSHRKWIESWMYSIAGSHDGDRSSLARTDSLYNAPADMNVHALNNKGANVSSWKFVNAWPTALGDITLDWSSDTIQEYTIEFAYEYWTHGHINAVGVDVGKGIVDNATNIVPDEGAPIKAT